MNKPWSKRNAIRRKNDIKHKNKIKERYMYYNWYPGITEETNEQGKKYYKIYYDGKAKKFLKQYASRQVRNYKGLKSGSHYKRIFDLWWELY